MLVYKVFITRKMPLSDDMDSVFSAEGHKIHGHLSDVNTLGVFILNTEFMLTVDRVKRLERLFGSIFNEKVSVLY